MARFDLISIQEFHLKLKKLAVKVISNETKKGKMFIL